MKYLERQTAIRKNESEESKRLQLSMYDYMFTNDLISLYFNDQDSKNEKIAIYRKRIREMKEWIEEFNDEIAKLKEYIEK